VVAIIDVFDYVTANDILFDAPAGRVIRVGNGVPICRVRGRRTRPLQMTISFLHQML